MKLSCRSWFVVTALVLPFIAQATIYKKESNDGQTIYSDSPDYGGDKVDLSPLHRYQHKKLKPSSSIQSEHEIPAEEIYPPWAYSLCHIMHPQAEETFQNTGGVLPVEIQIQPRLYPNDELVVNVNGQALARQVESQGLEPVAYAEIDQPVTLGFTLNQIPRGTQQLQAYVMRDGKPICTSQIVTLYVKQRSVLLPAKK